MDGPAGNSVRAEAAIVDINTTVTNYALSLRTGEREISLLGRSFGRLRDCSEATP